MSNVIEFKKIDKSFNLDLEDIINLFLICKSREGILIEFDLNILIQSIYKYIDIERFNSLYTNIKPLLNESNKFINELENILVKKVKEKAIVFYPSNKNQIFIIGNEEYFLNMKNNYSAELFDKFNELMFCINNDLEFGIDNWEIIAEDEYISDSIYPGIVTGEFIGQDKIKKTRAIKKRMIENLKNIYN